MKSAVQTINHMKQDALPSLMLPVGNRTLLLPSVAVAEMVSYTEPKLVDVAPDWLLGHFTWREQEIPLLSLERLLGQAISPLTSKSRIAVLNNTGLSDELPFLALVTSGIPRLVRLTEGDIQTDTDHAVQMFDRLWVRLDEELLVIPDVTALEQAYLSWKTQV